MEPQEVGEREQTLVVVEIPLQKVIHILDVHRGLHLNEFFLKRLVLQRFDKSQDFAAVFTCFLHIHCQEFRWWARPILIWLHQKVLSRAHGFMLFLDLLLHLCDPSLLLLAGSFHLGLQLGIDVPLFPFLAAIFFKPECSEFGCRILE